MERADNCLRNYEDETGRDIHDASSECKTCVRPRPVQCFMLNKKKFHSESRSEFADGIYHRCGQKKP